jgi:hypothetical protein
MTLKDELIQAKEEVRALADKHSGIHSLRGDVFLLDGMIVRLDTEPLPTPEREYKMQCDMDAIVVNARMLVRRLRPKFIH